MCDLKKTLDAGVRYVFASLTIGSLCAGNAFGNRKDGIATLAHCLVHAGVSGFLLS